MVLLRPAAVSCWRTSRVSLFVVPLSPPISEINEGSLTKTIANFTMSKLVEWIPRIRAAFTHVVPFASAYNWTTPYAESNEAFPSFEQYISNETASVPADGGSGPTGTLSTGGAGGASASATGPSGTGASQSGSTGTGTPSGTTSAGGSGSTTNAAAQGKRMDVGMGVGGVVVGAVLAWASI